MLSPLRKGRLTGSRIGTLMNGTAAEVLQLYLIVRGEAPEDDLSREWAVQLGNVTQELNLDWYTLVTGNPVINRDLFVPHPFLDWAGVTLDGEDEPMRCPVEAKHVGGHESLETVISRYQPQCQWQIECTGSAQCALSVIQGASPPVIEYLPREDGYIAEMIKRGAQFMSFVERGEPPVDLPEPPPPPPTPWKSLDMTGNNQWADFAASWLSTRDAANVFKEASDGLKEMVTPDVRQARGHGVIVKVNRAGSKSVRSMSNG